MVVLVFKSSLMGLCLLVRLFFPFIFNVIVTDPHPPSLYPVLLTSFIVCYLFLFSWNLSQAIFRWNQSCSGWYGQKPFQKPTDIPFYNPPLLFNYTVSYSFGSYFRNYNMCLPPPNLLCSGVFYCFLSRLRLPAVVTSHFLSALHPIVRLLLQFMLEMWQHCIRCTWSLLPHRYPVVCFQHSPLLPGSSHLHLDSLSFDLETFHGASVVCDKFFPFISTWECFCPFYYNICTYLREY